MSNTPCINYLLHFLENAHKFATLALPCTSCIPQKLYINVNVCKYDKLFISLKKLVECCGDSVFKPGCSVMVAYVIDSLVFYTFTTLQSRA